MKNPGTGSPALWMWVTAFVCAAGIWLFAQRVLIPFQVVDAAAHQRPRGNLSDLYPRWLGARELLLHKRNPYSPDVTREIQAGYYGRVLDPVRPNDPKDQEAFAYPVYIVFYLAPVVDLPFAVVKQAFLWLLVVMTLASALIWMRVLHWPESGGMQALVLVLTLGSLPAMQGLKLQQMTLLVASLLAIAILLLLKDRQVIAGVLLAAASIKPQVAVLPLLWLAIWTFGDIRRRYRWAVAFAAVMAVQIAAAEYYVPHWIPRFWQAIREYREYTGAMPVAEVFTGTILGRIVEVLAFVLLIGACWRARPHPASSSTFAVTTSMVLALTVLLIPTDSVYNQVLLMPALLLLVRDRRAIWDRGMGSRLFLGIVAVLVVWPWISSVGLVVLSLVLPSDTIQGAWAVPFWTVVPTPLGVAALMLAHAARGIFADSVVAATS